MQSRPSRDPRPGCLLLAVALLLGLPGVRSNALAQDNECLIAIHDHDGSIPDQGTRCQTASGKICTFDLQLCVNDPGCTAAALTKKVRAKGHCGPVGKLQVSTAPCGSFTGVKVHTRKNGKKPGTCTVRVSRKTSDHRTDLDKLTLQCMPQGTDCPGTTTTTVANTTTTTLRCGNGTVDSGEQCDPPGGQAQCSSGQVCISGCQCARVSCDPIVPGQPIPNTYMVSDILGPKICLFGASANALLPCQSDADCGGDVGACVQTPWISAGGVSLPFPLGINATYTVATADGPPTCSHQVCISCGNPNATCPGMTGCATAGNCTSTTPTCCDQPGFTVPTFFISGLNVCVKVDQKQCGVGVVNTSNPQTGDNEVSKAGDTSDPGPDCTYGTADDPAPKACNAAGAGGDKAGKIVRTLGNGTADSAGVHSRFTISLMATAWQSTQVACTPTSTFDPGSILLTQLILNAELSTAGATGVLSDLNGDGCKAAGVGFGGNATAKFGPVTLGAPSVSPAPYGGGSNLMGSVGLVFPGSAPLYDIGFIAFVPFGAPTVVTGQACSCSPTPGCPE